MGLGLPRGFLKNIIFVIAFLLGLVLQEGYSQTSLSPGDIAIVTVNADGDDNFDFVPLVDLESGTEIYFTDIAYIESIGGLDSESGEGVLKYNTQTKVDAGSVISYSGSDGNGFEQISGNYSASVSGDNIIVYQIDTDTTYLYGIGWARGSSWEYNGDSNTSDIPPNLNESANTILNLGTTDNYQYDNNSGLEGTSSTLLSLIGDKNNWLEDDEETFSAFGSSFTLVDPPTVAFTTSTIDSSESSGTAELSIELVEANNTAVEVEVAFVGGSSTATNGEDFENYSTQTISFSDSDADGTTKTVSIDLTDDSEFEGSEKAVFQLQNISTGTIISPNVLTLTIEDNDAPNIVINEFLADPGGAEVNNDDNQSNTEDEYIEIVNNEQDEVDISNWTVSDAGNTQFTFPSGTVVGAERAILIFGGGEPSGNFGGAYIFTASGLSLNNGGDTITLEDENGNLVNEVSYTSSSSGISLNRDGDTTGGDGSFKNHDELSGADGNFSPGTKVDGTAFGSKYAVGIRGSAGWRMISTPTQNTSFNDLLGDLWMQGITGSRDPSGPLTLAGWSESSTAFNDIPSNMSDNMTPGNGYIVYVFEDDEYNSPGIQGTFPKVISTDGNENNETVSIAVSATDSNEDGEINGNEGWNLLGNPFGTDLSVSSLISELETVHDSVNANIYVWDHSNGNGNGGYITLGEGDRIAPFQAFFVRFDEEISSQNFEFDRNVLAANTGADFYKDNAKDTFSFNIQLQGEQYFDTYSLEFNEKATVDLDRYDAYKLFSLNANSINLYSTHGNIRLQKNVLPNELETNLEIPLSFDANGRTELTFRWDRIDDIPSRWDVMLVDRETNREIDLRNSQQYRFAISLDSDEGQSLEQQTLLNKGQTNEENGRFALAINPNIKETDEEIPESVKLNPNYPNPFNPTTTIPYEIAEDAEVKLTVWNMIGQKVATLVDGMVEAGMHKETWNANNMPSGIYIARFEVNGNVFTRKMTLIK